MCFMAVYDKICTISGVPRVNRGKKGKMQVDTPESWHTMCLIFGRDTMAGNIFDVLLGNQGLKV